MYLCMCVSCVRQKRPCQKHSCLHSDSHLIYRGKRTTHSPIPPDVFLWQHCLYALPLSVPFLFQTYTLYLIMSSSRAVWFFPLVSNCAEDTTWSPAFILPLIPTFPSPTKVRSLDCWLAVELRYIPCLLLWRDVLLCLCNYWCFWG